VLEKWENFKMLYYSTVDKNYDIIHHDKFKHKLTITAGRNLNHAYHRCRICGGIINSGEWWIMLHTIGEAPSYYHPKCATELQATLGEFVDSINAEES